VNIGNYIKFTVDTTGKNFSRWRKIILFLLKRYNARVHIESRDAYRQADDEWCEIDSTIVLCLYATISEALQDVMLDPDYTAFDAWDRLHTFFYDNRDGQAMALNQELRDTARGDLSIDEYCRRLIHISDQLAEVGAPISDRALSMQMVDGLGDKFEMQPEIFKNMVPFPTFAQAQSRLQLAERNLARKARTRSAQALAVQGGGGGRGTFQQGQADRGGGSQGGAGRGQNQGGQKTGFRGNPPPPGYVSPNYRGRNPIPGYVHGGGRGQNQGGQQTGGGAVGRGGRGASSSGRPAGGPSHQYVTYLPVGMPYPPPRPAYVPPNSASVLGPRPGSHHQAYPAIYTAPAPAASSQAPAPASPQYSFDANAMYQQAASYGSAFPPHADWMMDSRATSHVTGNQGF